MISSFLHSFNTIQKKILLVTSLILIASLFKAGYYTVHYGGTDLRIRVVAARMLDSGSKVYTYRWKPGDSERFLNPNNPRSGAFNDLTTPAGTLFFQSVFAELNYPLLRIVWTVFQYLLCLYIFCFFLLNKNTSDGARFFIVIIGGVFFLCSQIWFLNIERGQIYILNAFIFCILYQLLENKSSTANYFLGVVTAIAIYLRPSLIVVAIPFLFILNYRITAGFICAAIILCIHAYMHEGVWRGYFDAMKHYTNLSNSSYPVTNNSDVIYPGIIEGAGNLTLYKTDFICGGLSPINTWLSPILGHYLNSNSFYPVLFLVCSLGLIFVFKNKLKQKNRIDIILFGFLLYLLSELIIPAARPAYHMVVWLFPVLVFLQQQRLAYSSYVLLITALCFINGVPFYFPYMHDIGEVILIGYLIRYLLSENLLPAEANNMI